MNDKLYREFIQRQPSCLSGRFSEYVDGEGRCIAAHVRRAGKSGVAYKAEYSCVPLKKNEHDFQHQHGELACLRRFLPPRRAPLSEHTAKIWFDEQVEKYRALWLRHTGQCAGIYYGNFEGEVNTRDGVTT